MASIANCFTNHDADTRYARHISLPGWGTEAQQKITQAKVLVIGAGGLGAPLLLYLASAGIGTLGVVDADRVALSNLPRQILYETADIGRFKTEAAKDALLDRNPDMRVLLHTERLTAANAEKLLAAYDIIADGSDNFETRLLVNRVCLKQQKPLISAAIIGFSGQISTFKGYLPDAPCYECLIGGMPPEDTMPNCSNAGILNSVSGMMASWMATEVMKEITGLGESLSGYLLQYDGLNSHVRRSLLSKDPCCHACLQGIK